VFYHVALDEGVRGKMVRNEMEVKREVRDRGSKKLQWSTTKAEIRGG